MSALSTDSSKRDPQELLAIAEEVIKRGDILVIANDVDLTVSNGGSTGEDDPRNTRFYEKSGKALAKIEKYGHHIGFISNRSGWQVGRMANNAGIKHATIIGTYGLETFQEDYSHPSAGIATIDDRFAPYHETITDTLRQIRSLVFEYTGTKFRIEKEVEIAIPFYDEFLILERKGVCELFPEGLAAGYNFNLVKPVKRSELLSLMEKEYRRLLKAAMTKHHLLTLALSHVWGIMADKTSPETSARFSLKFEPLIKQGKAYGMIHLLQSIRNTLPEEKRIGLILFAGDSNTDAEAMKAAKQIVEFHNNDYIAHNPIHAFSIWVKPDHEETRARKEADIVVEGVAGYAEILGGLAEIASKYQHHSPFRFRQIFRI